MFGYAKEHEPCIIFMDEIDAIGGRRFSEGTSADREIQRTLMELLNQLDGFDYLGKTKIIMATNRPDTLDPALLRAGRLDRKIEIPLPNEVGRLEILKIHTSGVALDGEIDFESVVKMSDQLNGADLRNVVTEAYVLHVHPVTSYVDPCVQWTICYQRLPRFDKSGRHEQGRAEGCRSKEAGGQAGVQEAVITIIQRLVHLILGEIEVIINLQHIALEQCPQRPLAFLGASKCFEGRQEDRNVPRPHP